MLVVESDDQALESMRVMNHVNSLIGARGATFLNSFVNYSLRCPSRATFLTGQYMHNHQVVSNHRPNGGFERFESLHAHDNLAVWLQRAGYTTALIGKYLNEYTDQWPVVLGGSEWHAAPEGYGVYDYPINNGGTLGPTMASGSKCRLQGRRAHPEGSRLRQPSRARGPSVLPLAHLHRPPLGASGPEPQPAPQLPPRGKARATVRPCVRPRAAAPAAEPERSRHVRQAAGDALPRLPGARRGSPARGASTAAS